MAHGRPGGSGRAVRVRAVSVAGACGQCEGESQGSDCHGGRALVHDSSGAYWCTGAATADHGPAGTGR
ncbi:hypothetical protein STAFG_6724 [Streptomyces afghaniensis 772]|uniref:Uncharacterized protein n=1 Tax=Streptomyces afghaniensis 772 TaxID=1283301 RepID=S4MI85_9ACTN|nr:hypothetical protein STAFG_6724 [Streptomyces afghaniensis 772]